MQGSCPEFRQGFERGYLLFLVVYALMSTSDYKKGVVLELNQPERNKKWVVLELDPS